MDTGEAFKNIAFFEKRIKEWPPFVQTDKGMTRLRLKVDGLPDEVSSIPAAVKRIDALALMIGASYNLQKPDKRERLESRITDVMEFMYDPVVMDLLSSNLGSHEANSIRKKLAKGLNWSMVGHWEGPVLVVSPKRSEVDLQAPRLKPEHVAYDIAKLLMSCDIEPSSGKNGVLVRTLKALGHTAEFKINAEHSAREAVKALRSQM
ncbi:MAG: hypothetical protein Hals2KO_02500 [Halioglobus sp.]